MLAPLFWTLATRHTLRGPLFLFLLPTQKGATVKPKTYQSCKLDKPYLAPAFSDLGTEKLSAHADAVWPKRALTDPQAV